MVTLPNTKIIHWQELDDVYVALPAVTCTEKRVDDQ